MLSPTVCEVGLTKWRNKGAFRGNTQRIVEQRLAYFGVPSRTYVGPMADTRIRKLMAIALSLSCDNK